MAGSFNRVTIVGNLGRDPETRALPSGDTVADFTVATTERRRGPDGGTQETTTWFRVSAFGKLGETAQQYLRKGSYVYIDGTLALREYTDREGQPRQSLEIRARDLRMLDRREDRDDNARPLALTGAGASSTSDSVGDLPF
jgi:single-strand DNA-binding protein